MQSPRSIRTRKALAAAGIVLAGLSLGTGAAGAFPNGPGEISDAPQEPQPPMGPDVIADAPDAPQPPQGPQDWGIPEPGPVQPVPGPQGGGTGGQPQGGGPGGGQQEQAGPAGPSAEDFAAIADALAADEAETAEVVEHGLAVSDVQITMLGRGEPRESGTELAAGELSAEQAQSGPWALFAALAAIALAGIAALVVFLARRRDDEAEVGAG